MATFNSGDVSIYYEEHGSGYPLLLLAAGGMNSTTEMWARSAINPLESYRDDFRLIAMDQRNAGRSTGPFTVADPWGSYIDDQLGLMDHLGIDSFLVLGCCIGASYALKLSERAPERITASVLVQPIGVTEENRPQWLKLRRDWVTNLVATRSDLDEPSGEAFGARMWDGGEFVVSVSKDYVRTCPTPLFVLPGIDPIHPLEIGLEIAQLAPYAELIDPWKDTPEHVAQATDAAREFLQKATVGH